MTPGDNSGNTPGNPNLFAFWWSCCWADAELAGDPIKRDAIVLHFSGSGASAIVHARDLDAVCTLITRAREAKHLSVRLEKHVQQLNEHGAWASAQLVDDAAAALRAILSAFPADRPG